MATSDENTGKPWQGLSRRTVLQGLGGLAAGASGLLNTSASFAAGAGEFAAWFGPGGADSGAGLTWVHGLNLSMTGQGAEFGRVMSQGAELAAEIITASGGPKFSIAINDHQSGLVPPAVQGVRRLISQEGIKSLASSYGAATEAVFPIINQFGVTTFWTGGPSPSGLNKPFVFITIGLWALDATPGGIAYLAQSSPKAKRLAILGVTENGLPAVNELAPKAWSELTGGEVVYKELVNAGSTDFSAVVGQIRAANADAIYTTVYGNDLGFFIKQAREAGITAPILVIDLGLSVADIAGSSIEDNCFLATDGYLIDNPNPYNQAFVKAYRTKYNADPDYFAANFFEGTMIVWAAIQRAIKAGTQPGRGTALVDAIRKEPIFPSLYGGSTDAVGKMTFNEDHSVTKPMGVFKIGKGGVLAKVASIEKGSTKLGPA